MQSTREEQFYFYSTRNLIFMPKILAYDSELLQGLNKLRIQYDELIPVEIRQRLAKYMYGEMQEWTASANSPEAIREETMLEQNSCYGTQRACGKAMVTPEAVMDLVDFVRKIDQYEPDEIKAAAALMLMRMKPLEDPISGRGSTSTIKDEPGLQSTEEQFSNYGPSHTVDEESELPAKRWKRKQNPGPI